MVLLVVLAELDLQHRLLADWTHADVPRTVHVVNREVYRRDIAMTAMKKTFCSFMFGNFNSI